MDTPSVGQPNGKVSMETPTNNGYGQDNQLRAAAQAANQAGAVAAGNTAAPSPFAAAIAQAGAHQPASLLDPTDHPDEPITAGLPIGAGGGPELLGRPTVPRITRTLDNLAAATGNPVVASLAGEAAARNL